MRLRCDPEECCKRVRPEQLLESRREEDVTHDLWTTYSVIEEAVIKGGLEYRAANRRIIHSRGIRAIREDVRLNVGLWNMAVELVA